MVTFSGAIDRCLNLLTGAIELIMSVHAMFGAFLEANHKVMSMLLQFGADFLAAVWAALHLLFVVIYTIGVCLIEFVCELANFVTAFLFLLWKLLLLLCSLLDLIFHFLECVVYFLWTGGIWTATTIKVSGQNLSENGLSTWKYFVMSIKEFSESVVGGFMTIGEFAKAVATFLCSALFWTVDNIYELIHYMDYIVRYGCRYCFETSYYFVSKYLLSMPKEAYLGIVISCCVCLILKGVATQMCSRGLTFPITDWFTNRSFIDEYDSDFEEVDRDRGEFSDDEDAVYRATPFNDLDDNADEYSVNSDISDESDDDEDDDDDDSDGELEVADDSDNESNAASESELSEINIDLPNVNNSHRRSVTPSRLAKNMSADDMQKYLESEKEKRLCVVCQDRNKSVLILPCRHMCLCVDCGNHIARARRERRKCPLCRGKITTVMNVYV